MLNLKTCEYEATPLGHFVRMTSAEVWFKNETEPSVDSWVVSSLLAVLKRGRLAASDVCSRAFLIGYCRAAEDRPVHCPFPGSTTGQASTYCVDISLLITLFLSLSLDFPWCLPPFSDVAFQDWKIRPPGGCSLVLGFPGDNVLLRGF